HARRRGAAGRPPDARGHDGDQDDHRYARNMKEASMTDLSGLETTPEVGDDKLGPAGAAVLIADFVDVLIPGERLWPSASSVCVQGQLALRLMEERGKNALPTLVKAIEAAGGPLDGLDEAARVAVVQRF